MHNSKALCKVQFLIKLSWLSWRRLLYSLYAHHGSEEEYSTSSLQTMVELNTPCRLLSLGWLQSPKFVLFIVFFWFHMLFYMDGTLPQFRVHAHKTLPQGNLRVGSYIKNEWHLL